MNHNVLTATGITYKKQVAKNVEDLFPYMVRPVDMPINAGKGKPAFIISAGPSLQKELPLLKDIPKESFVLVCDSAIKPALDSKISKIDYVGSVDSVPIKAPLVADKRLENSSFICLGSTHKKFIENFPGKEIIIPFTGQANQIYLSKLLNHTRPVLPCAVYSVAHLLLGAAIQLGCSPIVLVGQDLCYTLTGDTHANSVVGVKPDNKQAGDLAFLPWIECNDGVERPTEHPFITYLTVFNTAIKDLKLNVVNTALTGAKIIGSKVLSLKAILRTKNNDKINSKRNCSKAGK